MCCIAWLLVEATYPHRSSNACAGGSGFVLVQGQNFKTFLPRQRSQSITGSKNVFLNAGPLCWHIWCICSTSVTAILPTAIFLVLCLAAIDEIHWLCQQTVWGVLVTSWLGIVKHVETLMPNMVCWCSPISPGQSEGGTLPSSSSWCHWWDQLALSANCLGCVCNNIIGGFSKNVEILLLDMTYWSISNNSGQAAKGTLPCVATGIKNTVPAFSLQLGLKNVGGSKENQNACRSSVGGDRIASSEHLTWLVIWWHKLKYSSNRRENHWNWVPRLSFVRHSFEVAMRVIRAEI